MARDRSELDYVTPLRRIGLGLMVVLCLGLFLLWRIDSPRVERLRAELADAVLPRVEWLSVPGRRLADMAADFQSYQRLHAQNRDLRRELQQMRAWKEAAVQLEQQNAKLLALNNVRLDPKLTSVSGVVIADSGSPFRQSVLLNVGARDGIVDGWAVMDGLGVVGRISGVGRRTSRVLLLTDTNSRVPVTIQPSGQQAMLTGDNTPAPILEFLEAPEDIAAGDRIVTSGDGGLFPPGLLVGQVVETTDRHLRARLAADMARLRFLRVMRSHPGTSLDDPGELIGPPWPPPEGFVQPPGMAPQPRPDRAARLLRDGGLQ